MADLLRHIYNKIDSLFDRKAITDEVTKKISIVNYITPQTALKAYENVIKYVYEFDKQSKLKMIVSPEGIDQKGASPQWEFFFDLAKLRAKMVCVWKLEWDNLKDDYTRAVIQLSIKPFPLIDSPVRQMVKEGNLLHKQMIGMWYQELKRTPALSNKFIDTDIALDDFIKKGLDIAQDEFSLSTGKNPNGKTCWIAQTRNKNYYSNF